MLDAVAERLIPATATAGVRGHLHRSRRRRRDRGPDRQPRGHAEGGAHRGPGTRPRCRPGAGCRRDRLSSPFYGGDSAGPVTAVKITAIRIERLRLPLDPPFHAAWARPAPHFDATIVRVDTDEGVTGIGSGDTMAGFEDFEHLFLGRDPLALSRHARTLETISFHAGRYWPLEAALWDLAGRALGVSVASLLGGWRSVCRRTRRWASCGRRRSAPTTLAGAGAAGLQGGQGPDRAGADRRGSRGGRGDPGGRRRAAGDPRRSQPVVADGRRHRARAWGPRTRAG